MYISVYNTGKKLAMHEPKRAQRLSAGVSIILLAKHECLCYTSNMLYYCGKLELILCF